jgi:hypothetical protein
MSPQQATTTGERISELWLRTTAAQVDLIVSALKGDQFSYDQVSSIVSEMYMDNSRFFELTELRDRVQRIRAGKPDPLSHPNSVESQSRKLAKERKRERELEAQYVRHQDSVAALEPEHRQSLIAEFLTMHSGSPVHAVYTRTFERDAMPKSFLAWAAARISQTGAV